MHGIRMKRCRWSAVIAVVGCVACGAIGFHKIQMYEGPPAPPGEAAVLHVYSKAANLWISEVDGQRVPYRIDGMVDQRDCDLQLLPGTHVVRVKLRRGQLVQEHSSVDLSFTAEPGQLYGLGADRDYGASVVEYQPYITNVDSKEIVSAVVHDSEE